MTKKNVAYSFSTCCFSSWTTSKIVAFKLEAPAYLWLLHVVFITKVKTGSVLSRHFLPCFDHVLLYYYRDTFEFSQGHVTKNQPMAVPIYEDNNSV